MKKITRRDVGLVLGGFLAGLVFATAVVVVAQDTAPPNYTPARAAQAFIQAGRDMSTGTVGCKHSLKKLGNIWQEARTHPKFGRFEAILEHHGFGPLWIKGLLSSEYDPHVCKVNNERRRLRRLQGALPGG